MSNDLISRKALMKIFSETIDGRRIPEYDCDGFPITISLSEIKKFIRQAPTAYDVDSVCKELEKRAERANRRSGKCEGLGKFSEAFLNNLEFNTIIEDIKTVRNGGKKE